MAEPGSTTEETKGAKRPARADTKVLERIISELITTHRQNETKLLREGAPPVQPKLDEAETNEVIRILEDSDYSA